MNQIPPHVEDFLDYLLKEKRGSVHTLRCYRSDLGQLVKFMDEQFGCSDLREVKSEWLRSYVVEMMRMQKAPRTIHRKVSAYRTFVKYAKRQGSMDDSWCCTASYKRGAMAIKEVKAFRRWHVKKSRVWQEGYHIWGRIVADKWLMKSQWAAKGTQDLFNLIMHKKVTFRGLLAWLVITPPAMLIGSYIVMAQRLDRRTAERSIS